MLALLHLWLLLLVGVPLVRVLRRIDVIEVIAVLDLGLLLLFLRVLVLGRVTEHMKGCLLGGDLVVHRVVQLRLDGTTTHLSYVQHCVPLLGERVTLFVVALRLVDRVVVVHVEH